MRALSALSLLLLSTVAVAADDFPQAEISSSSIRARLYLPDPTRGYYQATRFDWSGVIANLGFRGHDFFGQWFDRYDPKINDAIMGPVEEFLTNGAGLGYDQAKPGESFVKIGVGVLRKPDESPFQQFHTYDIVDPGKWTVKRGKNNIEFTHEIPNVGGYAYVYRKKMTLTGDNLIIEHRLKNTGRKTIDTSVYEHDFFMLDTQHSGPDFTVDFPFAPRAVAGLRGLAEIRGHQLVYLQELQPGQTILTELLGYGASPKDYDIRVENHKIGIGVHQTSDRPLAKLMFWSIRTTVCPEAYIDLKIQPGQESAWRISYEFYDIPR